MLHDHRATAMLPPLPLSSPLIPSPLTCLQHLPPFLTPPPHTTFFQSFFLHSFLFSFLLFPSCLPPTSASPPFPPTAFFFLSFYLLSLPFPLLPFPSHLPPTPASLSPSPPPPTQYTLFSLSLRLVSYLITSLILFSHACFCFLSHSLISFT